MVTVHNIHQRRYWNVTEKGNALFTGTHQECWKYLETEYPTYLVSELIEADIKIQRIK